MVLFCIVNEILYEWKPDVKTPIAVMQLHDSLK